MKKEKKSLDIAKVRWCSIYTMREAMECHHGDTGVTSRVIHINALV